MPEIGVRTATDRCVDRTPMPSVKVPLVHRPGTVFPPAGRPPVQPARRTVGMRHPDRSLTGTLLSLPSYRANFNPFSSPSSRLGEYLGTHLGGIAYRSRSHPRVRSGKAPAPSRRSTSPSGPCTPKVTLSQRSPTGDRLTPEASPMESSIRTRERRAPTSHRDSTTPTRHLRGE